MAVVDCMSVSDGVGFGGSSHHLQKAEESLPPNPQPITYFGQGLLERVQPHALQQDVPSTAAT